MKQNCDKNKNKLIFLMGLAIILLQINKKTRQ